MFSSKKKPEPDPKLENLRKEGLEPPPLDYDVNQMLEKSKNIHAGWLFDLEHLLLLHKLCVLLDGNFDTYNTPGWGSFGHYLGVSSEILKVIECSKLGHEGYTYYVLQHYIQKKDATIQKVIQALLNVKRFDIIHQTQSYFNKLVDKVQQHYRRVDCQQNNEDSGTFSSNVSQGEEEQRHEDLIRPSFIPTPPLVLREIKENIQIAATTPIAHHITNIENECLQTSDPSRTFINIQNSQTKCPQDQSNLPSNNHSNNKKRNIPKYDCKVMLTFADDGINYANEIAKALREKRDDGLQIGVLILNEHIKLVESNPELFIMGAFPQVDYVVPVITEGYLKAAVNLEPPTLKESLNLDSKYVRFIYILMNKYYVQNGCMNKKIRCIIPEEPTDLDKRPLMKQPVFETWVFLRSVNKLADRMLSRCIKKKNEATK